MTSSGLLLISLDFDWSVTNEVLVSVSSDGTARLWDPMSGTCVREICDGSSGRSLCCRFHPNNNNFVAVSLPSSTQIHYPLI